MNIIDILNTGVTGFSFLMLYLGYKLMSDVQSKIFEKDLETSSNIDMYKEWKSLVRSQLNNTRYFLAVSFIFFAGALFLLVYKAENKIILSLTPLNTSYLPQVYHQEDQLNFSKTGRIEVMVKDAENIAISNDKLITKLHDLSFSLESQEKANKQLVIINANKSRDSGF